MPTLHVQLLGPPAINYAGEPVSLQRRIQRGLLFYLAYHKEAVDRARLMLMFWPEADEPTARKRVRETLSRLRTELPDPALLVVDQEQVGLDRSRLRVDALEFNALFQQCHRVANSIPRHLPLPEQTHQAMRTAVEKWRSPTFMAGVMMPRSQELDRWVADTGVQLERRRVMLIDRLSDHYAASGDFEAAVSWLNLILEEDPGNAAWQARYLSWLLQLGRRSEALAYSSNLHSLYQQTGDQLPESLSVLTTRIRTENGTEAQAANPFWPPPSILQTNFVGRAAEMQALQSALQRGGVALLLGESGSGKTRLLQEFANRQGGGLRVLVAPAHPATQHLPYQPLLDMLRHAVSEPEWQAVSPVWIAPLTHLMPELNRYLPQPSRLEDSFLENTENIIFEALHQLLRRLAGHTRLLLFLDDAHHADHTTLDALAYLVSRGFFDRSGLLVVAARPEELSPALETFLTQVGWPSARLARLELGGLSLEETAELSTAVLGRAFPTSAVQKLLDSTGGQPLYLVETLREALEYSPEADLAQVIDRLPVSNSLRERILPRMRSLSPSALAVLQAAAVAGVNASPALLEGATSLGAEPVVRALEELEALHLLQPANGPPGGAYYQFPNTQVRRAVLSGLSAARRRLLHLAIARSMQALPVESANPSLVAQHFEAAGELKDAFDGWVRAGVKAYRMFSRQETRLCFGKAFALVHPLGNFVSDEEIYQLFLHWGDSLDDNASFHDSLKIFFELQTIGERRQSDLLLGTAFNGLCRAYRHLDDYARSLHYSDLALAHLEARPWMPEYLFAVNRRAVTLTLLDDAAGAAAALEKAAALAAPLKDRRVQIGMGSVFLQIASIWHFKGLPQRSLEIADMADRTLFDSVNNPDVEMIRISRAQAHISMGYPLIARQLCNQALQKAAEWNNRRLEAYARMVRSYTSTALGYIDEGLQDMEEALAISQQMHFPYLEQQICCSLGDLYRLARHLPQAEAAYRRGVACATHTYYRLDNEIRLAYTRFRLGHVEEGQAMLAQAIAAAEEGRFTYITLTARIMQASILIQENAIDQAEQVMQDITRECEETGVVILQTNIRFYRGLCALRKGRVDEACRILEGVVETTRQNGNLWVEQAALSQLLRTHREYARDTAALEARLDELRAFVLANTSQPELHAQLQQALPPAAVITARA